jgi:hypothetical protein
MTLIQNNNDFLPAIKKATKEEETPKAAIRPIRLGAYILAGMVTIALIFVAIATLIKQWDVLWSWAEHVVTLGGSFWGGVTMASIGIFIFLWSFSISEEHLGIGCAGLLFGAILWLTSFAATTLLSLGLETTIYQDTAIWFIRLPAIVFIFAIFVLCICVCASVSNR